MLLRNYECVPLGIAKTKRSCETVNKIKIRYTNVAVHCIDGMYPYNMTMITLNEIAVFIICLHKIMPQTFTAC
jgi:hypothetical protein